MHYIDSALEQANVRVLIERLAQKGVRKLEIIDVAYNWLWKRIRQADVKHGIIIWDEPVSRRRHDVNQALQQRKQLPDEDLPGDCTTHIKLIIYMLNDKNCDFSAPHLKLFKK